MIRHNSASILICVVAFSLLAPRTDGVPFKVIILDDGEEIAQGVGVWVADDVLLTASALVELGDQIFIENPNSGTRYVAVLRAVEASMALVSVDGLFESTDSVTITVTTISSQPPQPNSGIHFSLPGGGQRKGLLSFVVTPDSLIEFEYRFTMAMNSDEIGVPVMNRCEELISVASIHSDPDRTFVGISESYARLVSFLGAARIKFNIASDPCPTLEDQLSQAQVVSTSLQEDLDSLQSELKNLEESSEESLGQSAEQIDRLARQKAALESQIAETEAKLIKQDSVLKESERLQGDLDSLRERNNLVLGELDSLRETTSLVLGELDSLRETSDLVRDSLIAQESENRLHLLQIGGIAALLILIASVLLFLFWKRRRDAEQELTDTDIKLQEAEEVIQRKSATFPDLLLSGFGPANEEVRVKVSGEVLAQDPNGILLGRSSAHANCVIVENSVSRRHARITLVNDTLMICDLQSLNGTIVNGMRLAPRQNHPLSQGSQIIIGDVELTLTILQ